MVKKGEKSMKCKSCKHDKQDHFLDADNRFLRGVLKGEENGSYYPNSFKERYELFACNVVGCNCQGFKETVTKQSK